jgi:hypothetical protein
MMCKYAHVEINRTGRTARYICTRLLQFISTHAKHNVLKLYQAGAAQLHRPQQLNKH